MDNAPSHPALDRILKQIQEHKDDLVSPENTLERDIARRSESEPESLPEKELGDPAKDVSGIFTEEALKERAEDLESVDAELEKSAEEAAKKREIARQIEEGEIHPAEIPPPETEETKGRCLPQEVQDYFDSEKEEYEFHSCFDLRDFFEHNRDNFEDWALPAVDSVLSAVDSITSGCKCKLKERRKMVEDYYITFIRQNQHNSLIGKMKEILKTKKIKFYSEDELFLEV